MSKILAVDQNIRAYIELLYRFLHKHDRWQRPVTPSSGLDLEPGDEMLRRQPLPADYLDYHNYVPIYQRWRLEILRKGWLH